MRLFKSGGDGKADSLFGERFAKGHVGYDDVPAVRLSDALEKYAAPGEPVLLRMNIEGAELYVIDDLVAADAVDRVAGYFGMWDDLSKIDPSRDAGFRSTMRQAGIRPVTFNDRDLGHPLRVWAIRYDLDTAMSAWVGT